MTVTDPLPAGFVCTGASGQILTAAYVTGNTLMLDIGTLGSELTTTSQDTITIVGIVTSAAGSTITNTATLSASNLDPNQIPANLVSTAVTTVVYPAPKPTPTSTKYYYVV